MHPILDYIYGEEVKEDSGVVTTTEISDTKQTYKVLAIGPGRYENGTFIEPSVKVGDVVLIQKHSAEGDSPHKMLSGGHAMFMASRVMGVIK